MVEYKLRLKDQQEVKEFVNKAGKYDFDIDIFCNHRIVDGKSILGILGFDLSNVLIVRCNEKSEKFESDISEFMV